MRNRVSGTNSSTHEASEVSHDYFDPRVKVQATNILSVDHKNSSENLDRYPTFPESIHYDLNLGIPAGRKRWESYKRFHNLKFGSSARTKEDEDESRRKSYLSKKGRTLEAVTCSMPLSSYRDLVKSVNGKDPFPLKLRHHHIDSANTVGTTSTSTSTPTVKSNEEDPMVTTIAPLWNLHVHSKYTWEFVTNICDLN